MSGPCSHWPRIGRAVKPRDDARLALHLDDCSDCRAALEELERAVASVKAAPYEAPGADAREQARTRLVAAITPAVTLRIAARTGRRRLWLKGVVTVTASLFGATVLAAVATKVIEIRREAARSEVAQVEARAKRRGRLVASARDVPAVAPPLPAPAPPVLQAPPLARSPEPIRVLPRPKMSAPRPAATPAPPPPAEGPAPLTDPPEALVPPPAPPADPAELAFNQGWQALRAGDHRTAAALMERVLAAAPAGRLDEDARYWRAIALGRAGAAAEARGAMEQFLRLYPRSVRTGEVSAMLGWMLVEVGQPARARELFRAAERDASPAVQQSARAGLERVGR